MGLYGLFRLLLIALAVWWLYRLLKRWLAKDDNPGPTPAPNGGGPHEGQIEVMVQDPFCGTYIPKSEAVAARIDGNTVHFCSDKCRRGYVDALANTQKKEKQTRE